MTQTKYILRNDPKQKYTVGDEWVSSQPVRKGKRGNKQSNHKRSDDSKQSSNLIVKSIAAATGNDSPNLSVPEEEEVETVQAPVEKFKCRKCELVFDKTHLASHEQTCLKLGDKESFLKYNEPQVVLRDVRTKTALPSSQEGGAGDEKTASPAPFNKSFANAVRGTSENSDAHVDFSLTRESVPNAEKPSGSKGIDQNSVSNKIESKKPEVVKPQKQHKPQNPPTGKKKKLNKNEPAGKKSNDVSQATVPLTTVHL